MELLPLLDLLWCDGQVSKCPRRWGDSKGGPFSPHTRRALSADWITTKPSPRNSICTSSPDCRPRKLLMPMSVVMLGVSPFDQRTVAPGSVRRGASGETGMVSGDDPVAMATLPGSESVRLKAPPARTEDSNFKRDLRYGRKSRVTGSGGPGNGLRGQYQSFRRPLGRSESRRASDATGLHGYRIGKAEGRRTGTRSRAVFDGRQAPISRRSRINHHLLARLGRVSRVGGHSSAWMNSAVRTAHLADVRSPPTGEPTTESGELHIE